MTTNQDPTKTTRFKAAAYTWTGVAVVSHGVSKTTKFVKRNRKPIAVTTAIAAVVAYTCTLGTLDNKVHSFPK